MGDVIDPNKAKGKNAKVRFTKKEVDMIISLYNSNLGIKGVAEILGYSQKPVRRILVENNIPIRTISQIKTGKKYPKISESKKRAYALGLIHSPTLGRHTIPKNKVFFDKKETNIIIKDYQDNILPLDKIAEKHNCSLSVIYRILKGNNIPRKNRSCLERTPRILTKEEEEEIIKLYKEDLLTIKQISNKTGHSYTKISKVLHKNLEKVHSNNRIKKRFELGLRKIWNIGLTKETDKRVRAMGEKHIGQSFSEEEIRRRKEFRKSMVFPVKDSSIEVKIQNFLKQLGIEFYTHQYMKIYYAYQCDIYIPKQIKIYSDGSIIEIKQPTIIECDGDYWHGNPETQDFMSLQDNIRAKRCLDFERTEQLKLAGYNIIRLWGHEIRPMELNKFREITNNGN